VSITAGSGIKFDVTRFYTALVGEPDVQAPKLGTTFKDDQGIEYQFVLNSHSADQVAGYVGFRDLSGGLRTSVKKCATAVLDVMAGVWMSAVPAAGYGWIQTLGVYASVLVESTTDIVIGDSLKGVDAQFYVVKDQAIGTAPSYVNHIRALAARTSNDSGALSCLIYCPLGV
jgi:hypothetical protein